MPTTLDLSGHQGHSAFPTEALLSAIVESSDDAIISKDLCGIITSWNNSAERIFGYSSEEAIGRSITILLPSNRLSEETGILQKIGQGDRLDHFETVRRRKDGKLIDVSVTISPIRAEDGRIVGASKVARDITEQKQNYRARLLLAAIVDSSDDAIVSKNLDGIITSWNGGAKRIFGYTSEEAVGRPVLMLLPEERKDEESKILEHLRRGERIEHFETIRVRKNGERFPVSLTISPVRDHSGTIVGASKIARDITELRSIVAQREQLLEGERIARTQAEQANRMKDEFLATLSHELRTPLSAIVAWTQLLKEEGVSPGEISKGIEIIEQQTRIQAQLIDELLDLGRIVTGKLTLNVEWLDLEEPVYLAIASVQHAADAKVIQIRTHLDSGHIAMMGDKQRLQQVLWNLLSNAIKFSPKNGIVTVKVGHVDSHLEVAVSDNGCGIAANFLPYVFERFRQADSSTTRQFGGLGIGLAIVKQLVELHGGQVRAESPGIGQGATFVFSIPIGAARPESPSEKFGKTASAPIHPLDNHPSENLDGTKVLVVDDDVHSLDVIKRILCSRNAEIQTATSAESALEILRSFRPDVILSDIGMPFQDGYDFIRRVRQMAGGRSIPAAALTALVRVEDRMRALKAGFQTHVPKPIAPAELIAVVRSLAGLNWKGKGNNLDV